MLFNLTACTLFYTNKGTTERQVIEYTDGEIDKESLDAYFLSNEEDYPSYNALKANTPSLLDNVKMLKSSESFIHNLELFRFSSNGNGFLDGETFIYDNNNYYQLGGAFGGYGLTEFVRRQGNGGHWLYFVYSFGSGIHRTEIGIFDLLHNGLYFIKDLTLEQGKDFTFMLDESDNSIDLYEATITPNQSDDGFDTYLITKDKLAFQNIDDMGKTKV